MPAPARVRPVGVKPVVQQPVVQQPLVRLVVLFVVVAVVGSACGASARRATSPRPAPVPPSSAAATTTTPAAAAATSWIRDTAPALAVGGGATTTLSAELAPPAVGDPWIVVGTREAADGVGQATVWTSPDAVAWTPAALTPPAVRSEATAAAAFDGGTVVVGSVGSGADRTAAVWRSSGPGAPFVELPEQPAFAAPPGAGADSGGSGGGGGGGSGGSGSGGGSGGGGGGGSRAGAGSGGATGGAPVAGGARMTTVAAGALGVFATGTAEGQQALWYSTDGRHFTRDSGAEKVIDASPRPVVSALVVTQDGVFAAGTVGAGTQTEAAVWTSNDGLHWRLEADPGHVFSGRGDHEITGLLAVERFPGLTFVAVGAVDTGAGWTPASWLSPDGTDWSAPSLAFPESHPPPPGDAIPGVTVPDGVPSGQDAPGGTTADGVAATAEGFVAVGGGEGEALVWSSPDGRSWTPEQLPPGPTEAAWHAGLVAADASTTLVGDPDAGQPHLLADAAGVAGGAGGAGSWRELTTDAAVWGTPQPQAVPVSLTSDGSVLRLVVDVSTPAQQLGPVAHSVVELVSTGGGSWQVSGGTAAFAGGTVLGVAPAAAPAGAAPAGAAPAGAAVPAGLLAVGVVPAAAAHEAGGTAPVAAAWRSTDGETWARTTVSPGGFGTGAQPVTADAVTALGSGQLVAVGTGPTIGVPAGGAPQAWTTDASDRWGDPTPLDGETALTAATPVGVCTGARGPVAVGGATSGLTRSALAWDSEDGTTWHRASVPAPAGGGSARMAGCALVGTTLVAWGSTSSAAGGSQPALWTSATGSTWSGRRIAAFDSAASAASVAGSSGVVPPLTDLAETGAEWIAAGGTTTAPSTAPGSGIGLWRSSDGGTAWTRVDTDTSVWASTATASLDAVAWSGRTAVVAGTVDGRLAVWVDPGDT